jgi:hypothetical protein
MRIMAITLIGASNPLDAAFSYIANGYTHRASQFGDGAISPTVFLCHAPRITGGLAPVHAAELEAFRPAWARIMMGDDEGEAGKEGIAVYTSSEVPIGSGDDVTDLRASGVGDWDSATGDGEYSIGTRNRHGGGEGAIEAARQLVCVNSFNVVFN